MLGPHEPVVGGKPSWYEGGERRRRRKKDTPTQKSSNPTQNEAGNNSFYSLPKNLYKAGALWGPYGP